MDTRQCIRCHKHARKVSGRKKTITTTEDITFYERALKTTVPSGSYVCENCRKSLCYQAQSMPVELNALACDDSCTNDVHSSSPVAVGNTSSESSDEESTYKYHIRSSSPAESDPRVEMEFSRVVATHKYCFICGPSQTTNQLVVPFNLRLRTFASSKIFIPDGNRCCNHHILHGQFYEEDIRNFRLVSPTSLVKQAELQKLIKAMCDLTTTNNLMSKFDDCTLSNDRLKVLTGLQWDNIFYLRNMIVSMRKSDQRTITQALIIFMMKLRSAQSDELIAATLDMSNHQEVWRCCHSIENAFDKDILPSRFGFKSQTREFLLQQRSVMADKLHNFGNHLAIICDGTYIRHQKSRNLLYQKKSYSGQKKTHLVKPFTVCTTNGYVIAVPGPFTANQNDAQILRKVLEDTDNGFKALLRPGDIFILDRGFRDVVQYLQDAGYRVLMPALKKPGQKQVPCLEANASRLVTKVRWVVESIHGHIGSMYKYFHQQLLNTSLPKIELLCKIANFLHNEFGRRLGSDSECLDDIVKQIEATKNMENPFADEVKENNWNRKRKPFHSLSASEVDDFPILSEQELRKFFTGSYQLKLATAYLDAMMKDGEIPVKFLTEATGDTKVLKVEVPSRHRSNVIYRCYIKYKPNTYTSDGIIGYACECFNGLRTVGACAHVAAVIDYLCHERYQSRIVMPAAKLTKLFLEDNIIPVIAEDSDDD